MKQLAILIYSLLVISCNPNGQTQIGNMLKSEKGKYAIELIDNDFQKYADSSKVDSSKTQLIDSFDIYEDNNYKIAHIDAEELAEFSFDFFLPNLERILAKRDITFVSKAKLEAGIEAPESKGKMPVDKTINQGIKQVNKGIGALDTSVEIGVESRSSLISGAGSVSGTGILNGVTLSQW